MRGNERIFSKLKLIIDNNGQNLLTANALMTACGSFNHVDEWLMEQDDQEELIKKGLNHFDNFIMFFI